MMRAIGLILIVLIFGVIFFFGYSSSTVNVEISGEKYQIPSEYIKNGSGFSFFGNEDFDKQGPMIRLDLDDELGEEIEGYSFYQDSKNKFPSIFSVLIYDGADVDQYASEHYENIVNLKGGFLGASIVLDRLSGYYRVTPNVEKSARWVYLYKDPRTIDNKIEKINNIVAECNSILPLHNLVQCTLSVEKGGIFIQINLSEVNIALSDKLIEVALNKLSQWKIE